MSKWVKFVCFGCSHGDLVDDSNVRFLQKFIGDYKPDYRINLGDNWDFRGLRKGIGATDSDAFDDFDHDVTKGFLTLDRLDTNVLELGNHDWRLWRLASEHVNAIVKSAAKAGVKRIETWARTNHCKLLPYHAEKGVFRLADGNAVFVHGYTANTQSVRQHATHYANPGGIMVMAHLHTPEYSPAQKHGGAHGYCVGTIARFREMEYAAHRFATSRWGAGFVYGAFKGSKVIASLVRKDHGTWLLPNSIL